jgi:hypothetical protein
MMWTYYGVNVYPCGRNNSGLRWEAYCGRNLRADTKDGMRDLIRHYRLRVSA